MQKLDCKYKYLTPKSRALTKSSTVLVIHRDAIHKATARLSRKNDLQI